MSEAEDVDETWRENKNLIAYRLDAIEYGQRALGEKIDHQTLEISRLRNAHGRLRTKVTMYAAGIAFVASELIQFAVEKLRGHQ